MDLISYDFLFLFFLTGKNDAQYDQMTIFFKILSARSPILLLHVTFVAFFTYCYIIEAVCGQALIFHSSKMVDGKITPSPLKFLIRSHDKLVLVRLSMLRNQTRDLLLKQSLEKVYHQ